MRRILQILVLAALALAPLVGGASGALAAPGGDSDGVPVLSALYARVSKPFGAAIRVAPDSDAPIMFHTPCGDTWPVIGQQGGWVQIQTGVGGGWIGGARVVTGAPPPPVNCAGGRFVFTTGYVSTYVPTGCLSLRAEPSREGRILACVPNGHIYLVTNGPLDPGTGEDWFEVYSPRTGTGWSLAAHLYPT